MARLRQRRPRRPSLPDYFVLFNSSSKIQIGLQVPPGLGGSYSIRVNVNDPTITLGVWRHAGLASV